MSEMESIIVLYCLSACFTWITAVGVSQMPSIMRGIFAMISTAEQTEWTRYQKTRINTKYYGLFRQLFKLAFSMDFRMLSAAGSIILQEAEGGEKSGTDSCANWTKRRRSLLMCNGCMQHLACSTFWPDSLAAIPSSPARAVCNYVSCQVVA